MTKIKLKQKVKIIVIQLVCSKKIRSNAKELTFDEWKVAILFAVNKLDYNRREELFTNQYYLLRFRKYWKRFKTLPNIIEIEVNEEAFFLYYLEVGIFMFFKQLEGEGNEIDFSEFEWE